MYKVCYLSSNGLWYWAYNTWSTDWLMMQQYDPLFQSRAINASNIHVCWWNSTVMIITGIDLSVKTRCVRETQMPLITANSKDGQDHKDKYLDNSRKILSQEMLMCNMKALIFIIQKLWPMSIFKKKVKCQGQKV